MWSTNSNLLQIMEKRIKQITSPKASKKTSWIMNKNIYCLKKDDLKISNNHNFFPLIQQWPYGLVASVSFCEFRSRGQIRLIKLGQNLYIYIYIYIFPLTPKIRTLLVWFFDLQAMCRRNKVLNTDKYFIRKCHDKFNASNIF